jgi:hypothetical protein
VINANIVEVEETETTPTEEIKPETTKNEDLSNENDQNDEIPATNKLPVNKVKQVQIKWKEFAEKN